MYIWHLEWNGIQDINYFQDNRLVKQFKTIYKPLVIGLSLDISSSNMSVCLEAKWINTWKNIYKVNLEAKWMNTWKNTYKVTLEAKWTNTWKNTF